MPIIEARIENARLKKIFESVVNLFDLINIDCNPDGMISDMMDSSHVSLTSMRIPKDAFEFYECKSKIRLGMSITSLFKILKSAGNKSKITLSVDKRDSTSIDFMAEEGRGRATNYSLKLVEIESDTLAVPECEFKAVIRMSASDFSNSIRKLTNYASSEVGDFVTFLVNEYRVSFILKGSGENKCSDDYNYTADGFIQDTDMTVERESNIDINLSLRYVSLFSKASPASDKVTIYMPENMPVRIEFIFSWCENGSITYYLAPRIDEGEDYQ